MSLTRAMQRSATRSVRWIIRWNEERKLDAALARRKAQRALFNATHKRGQGGRFAS